MIAGIFRRVDRQSNFIEFCRRIMLYCKLPHDEYFEDNEPEVNFEFINNMSFIYLLKRSDIN